MMWNDHIEHITSKANKRLHFLALLLRAGTPKHEVLEVYCAIVRSTLEYTAEVWHGGLTQEFIDKLEHTQTRALRMIFPDLSYEEARKAHSIPTLNERRTDMCRKLYSKTSLSQTLITHFTS